MKGGAQAPEWRRLHCRLGALSACGSFWSILPSHGVRHMGTFAKISFGRQVEQRGRVCNCIWFSMCLSSIPEWPPVLLALLTWLFYFWVEGLHLILQSESWFHITDTFVWMKTSALGELKTDGFDFSLKYFVQSLFISRYGNQQHPLLSLLWKLQGQLGPSSILSIFGFVRGKAE